MTNESLRGRLEIAESSYPIVSKIISDAIVAGWYGWMMQANPVKYAQYVPKWAWFYVTYHPIHGGLLLTLRQLAILSKKYKTSTAFTIEVSGYLIKTL